MKILSIILIIFFVCLTICEAGKKKKGSTKKEKGSSSQNPSDLKDNLPKDPIAYDILTRKIKTLDIWTGIYFKTKNKYVVYGHEKSLIVVNASLRVNNLYF